MGAKRLSEDFGAQGGCPEAMCAALAHLDRAHQYAQDTSSDAWDFAVEIGVLTGLGLTANDFRWLVRKGYAEHAREVTLSGESGRTFHPEGQLQFGRRTCFLLTPSGAAFACSVLTDALRESQESLGSFPASPTSPLDHPLTPGNGQSLAPHPEGSGHAPPPVSLLPHWDPDRRELRLGDCLVKRFRRRSPNQERILVVFEEEGWPPRIDDPLPRHPDGGSKRRLHDTIKGLNQKHQQPLIHFLGDGTGEGVSWTLIADAGEERK